MTVFVTGANGFIGRALVPHLINSGYTTRAGVRRQSDALPPAAAQVIVPDLGPDADWRPTLSGTNVVIHLAARVHRTTEDSADPLAEYRRVNVAGTLALARQAAGAGVRRFMFVSTVKVNGESTHGRPFTESDSPAPTDPYGISKAEAEAGLFALGVQSGIDIVVVRPPLVYGPGVKANFLAIIRWLRRGIPLPLGAIHDNRRSLLGIDNFVDLITVCLRNPAAANQVFLAADGEDLSTTALLRRTAAAMGVTARLIPIPAAVLKTGATLIGKEEVWERLGGSLQVDISKARTRLGWNPPVPVDEGLRRAVAPVLRTGAAT